MKIGDIEVGTEYAVADGRRRSYGGPLPRRISALAIETTEKDVWIGGGYSTTRGKRKQRVVRVRFEDEATRGRSYYASPDVYAFEKDAETTLEARFLVAPWNEVKKDVTERIDRAQREEQAKREMQSRIVALLPKRLKDEWLSISSSSGYGRGGKGVRVDARLSGEVLDIIIDLAEKGAQQA